MYRRSITAALSLALVATVALPAAAAVPAFTVPISATSATEGTFTGSLRILRFTVEDEKLLAYGIVTGTLVDENGASMAIVRSVTLPLIPAGGTTGGAAPAALDCDILHLTLGPLDLDLLGLVVHLDRVVLDITAVPGAGNLLGNLLCAITGLLDGGGLLTQVAALLNQLLALLG
jgi:hypothetical protein